MFLRNAILGLAAAGLVSAAAPAFAQTADGTPGNPPGTAASRAVDRAAGTNTSGAYPSQSDGKPGNPSGTAASRAAKRATDGTTTQRSRHHATGSSARRHSSNPPGTAASRAVDRAAGTNTSGAYPSQSDGTPSNPSGTAASRALGATNSR